MIFENICIIDCYTDEPAGLGVPPYIGTYPRYIYGACKKNNVTPKYLTIDDIRFAFEYNSDEKYLTPKENQKTNIKIYNLTKNSNSVETILRDADLIILITGLHTPGKYLAAHPGTAQEVLKLLPKLKSKLMLCGPAASEHDSTHEGGKVTRNIKDHFHYVVKNDIEIYLNGLLNDKEPEDRLRNYDELQEFSMLGAEITNQLNEKDPVVEIELGRGCPRTKGCSFCTEWLRFRETIWRNQEDIANEIKAYYDNGVRHFRLGRQSCFFSYKKNSADEVEKMFKLIWKDCPEIETLHIDNANPPMVVSQNGQRIAKLVAEYCTPENIAAFGVESFDPEVQKQNTLNTTNAVTMKAIEILNKYGGEGNKILPGLNIIFGLAGESKKTNTYNMEYLTEILDKYKIRRINVRTVAPLPGTALADELGGTKWMRKNKKFYWKWRNDIRQKIDFPMLKKLYPIGTIMKDVIVKVWDGKNSFGHKAGTYPIICGVDGIRLEIGKKHDLEVVGHNKRSLICKPVNG